MNVAKTLGLNLKRFRTLQNMTQAALAEALGVSEQTVWYYESGSHWPKPDMVGQIAKTLKIKPWQLLADKGERGEPSLPEALEVVNRALGYGLVKL